MGSIVTLASIFFLSYYGSGIALKRSGKMAIGITALLIVFVLSVA